jgi:hypothetical protein
VSANWTAVGDAIAKRLAELDMQPKELAGPQFGQTVEVGMVGTRESHGSVPQHRFLLF